MVDQELLAAIGQMMEDQNVVPPIIAQSPAQHLVELHIALGVVHAAKTPPLQLHTQLIIGG